MVREMLSVLMDGIKDADMLIDYAAKAKEKNDTTYDWFLAHAKTRINTMMEDYKAIDSEIGLELKANAGDEIAEALMCHLKNEMERLKMRLS